ncbi:MAG: hypothetical protein Q9220_007810, partial [cf. Caloplaca sp. 1 TL-2023]
FAIMDINTSTLNSTDPKSQIMNQIRQEAAVNNARALITVRHPLSSPPNPKAHLKHRGR